MQPRFVQVKGSGPGAVVRTELSVSGYWDMLSHHCTLHRGNLVSGVILSFGRFGFFSLETACHKNPPSYRLQPWRRLKRKISGSEHGALQIFI